MTDYLSGWNVGVDPEQTALLPDGSVLQEVTLVLLDEEAREAGDTSKRWLEAPVAVTLAPAQARKVAARLYAAAAEAEHEPPTKLEES
ncbi:MAG: hypothetical protein ACRDK7_01650 [Solirubrobacteraceae bacterium]